MSPVVSLSEEKRKKKTLKHLCSAYNMPLKWLVSHADGLWKIQAQGACFLPRTTELFKNKIIFIFMNNLNCDSVPTACPCFAFVFIFSYF